MPKPKVYVETSVISYLTALPSRDLVLAAHQQVTREWWSGRNRFELLVSDAVLEEIARGDEVAAGIAVLSATGPAQEAVCRAAGFRPPVICTPLELQVEEDQ